MPDVLARRDQLLGLLPRIYTAQPDGSAIGTLLWTMASALAAFDDDLARALHDRWLGLAAGLPLDPAAHMPSALERLGRLLDVPRLDKTGPVADRESAEVYRQRLRITARVLTTGLATPRAILALALATLGGDPCPRMVTGLDSTRAWCVPPDTRKRCTLCRGGVEPAPPGALPDSCPMLARRLFSGTVFENPPTPLFHAEPALRLRREVQIDNASLIADRPALVLRAPVADVSYPALQNCGTGEIILFAGILRHGDLLTVLPGMTGEEAAPFESDDPAGVHPWLAANPLGQATLETADHARRDVGRSIFFLWGNRFDDMGAMFGGPSVEGAPFGVLDSRIRTPSLRPGSDTWQALTFGNPESTFDDPTSVFAATGAAAGTIFATMDVAGAGSDPARARVLLDAMRRAETATPPPSDILDVRLSWFARPPASFRLRIVRNDAVDSAERRGGVEALRAAVDVARAAGVRALIDLPALPPQEVNQLGDRAPVIRARLVGHETVLTGEEGAPVLRPSLREVDRHGARDGRVRTRGVFDATPLDVSTVT